MRSDSQMLELILETARHDDRIRAVMLNGSRADPNATRDPFQDFDIVYLVRELESFRRDRGWVDRFGERTVMQEPDAFGDAAPTDRYAYLMQFEDGHRLDLTLKTGGFAPDSLSVLLLDKDGSVPLPAPPSERDYQSTPPTPKTFFECCNEFWWLAPYAAKGLWRDELLYTKTHVAVMRDQLVRMLEWRLLTRGQHAGKLGKRFKQLLEPDLWARFRATYADADPERTWVALFVMTGLFREVALEVAAHHGLEYPHVDDRRVTAHLERVRDGR